EQATACACRGGGPGSLARPKQPGKGEPEPGPSDKRPGATAGIVRSTFGRVPGGTRAAMRRRQRAPRPAATRARTAKPSEPRCASEVALALGRSWPVLLKSGVRYRRCGAWVTDQHEEICPACLQLAASSPSIRRVRHLALPPDLMNSENSSGRTLKPSDSSAAASLGAPSLRTTERPATTALQLNETASSADTSTRRSMRSCRTERPYSSKAPG